MIDRTQQGRGLGRALFRDCALRVAHAADTLGIRGLVVHAIFDQARAFYLALGFDPSPSEPRTLMVTPADIRNVLDEQRVKWGMTLPTPRAGFEVPAHASR